MNAYLSLLYKKTAKFETEQAINEIELAKKYHPHTKDLSNKIRSWLMMLNIESKNSDFYESDLCLIFKCKKEDLAIASIDVPLYSKIKNINGIRVRLYSIPPPIIKSPELDSVQSFLFICLQRGYVFDSQKIWKSVIPSSNFFELFLSCKKYDGTSRTVFGRTISKIGIGKSILFGNPPNRFRAFTLKPLDEARLIFATNVLNNVDYNWD
ncbi:hypothetical protein [Proteus appendicitidis]|uniref:Uncharacterized protein n=1 Tax=Proteus appendicitidis TaxID=3034648 RepID=A0ABY8Y4W7_9GAMM|nr:hypothetical protein [Proteus sp. HZ0627]WIV87438.1 hypothetical protein QQS39_13315 [Proteus sp. HZ0627]